MENNQLKKLTLTATDAGTTYTERFRSLCECVELTVKGRVEAGTSIVYALFGYEESGKEVLIYDKTLPLTEDGNFDYVHVFDPVSLAVYQSTVEYRACVKCAGSYSVNITMAEFEQTADGAPHERKCKNQYPDHPLKNVLFVGNSILLGFENRYGMCASSPRADYAYHVQQAILKQYPDCQFYKAHGSPLEHAESLEAFEEAFGVIPNIHTQKPFVESLRPDLDLIILQITDNVNTEKKYETFHTSAELLLQRIRERCPNAVIVWVYGWYHKRAIHARVLELCEQYAVEEADVRCHRYKANEAPRGAEYESIDGTKKRAQDNWISHPGDKGMKAIADTIISVLKNTSLLQ